jgi:predicted AlkP superfamily pyrophosphatase or phosphodiesterase
MHLKSIFMAAAFAGQVYADSKTYKYVAVFSIDGLHGSDVEKYVSLRPKSVIAELLENGYEYTSAYTSAPSDSFPGTLNQFTGASPRTTGVWYDDTYDRSFYPPFSDSKTNCAGPAGAEG